MSQIADRSIEHLNADCTVLVAQANAENLWQRRGMLFFKPCVGYAGKAA